MRDLIKMVLVLAILSLVSGGLLAAIRNGTKDQIENQQLTFVKGPAIKTIFTAAANDPIADRFKLQDGDVERTFFVGKIDGKAQSVAFETYGKGFGGDIGLMVGVNVSDDKMVGAQVTTHSETPGLGSKAKDDPKFSGQFKGMELKGDFKVKNDGGQVDAISGATVSSRGVSGALTEASTVYARLKTQIAQKLQEF